MAIIESTNFIDGEIARFREFIESAQTIVSQVSAAERALAALEGKPYVVEPDESEDLAHARRAVEEAQTALAQQSAANADEIQQLKVSLRTEIDRSASLRAAGQELEARVQALQSANEEDGDSAALIKTLRTTCTNLRGEMAQKAEEVTRLAGELDDALKQVQTLTTELSSRDKGAENGVAQAAPQSVEPPASAPIIPLRANKAIGKKRYVALPEDFIESMQTGEGFVVFMDGPRIVLLPEDAATAPPTETPAEPAPDDEPGSAPETPPSPGPSEKSSTGTAAPDGSSTAATETEGQSAPLAEAPPAQDNRPMVVRKRDEVERVVRELKSASGRDVVRRLMDEGHLEGSLESHAAQLGKLLYAMQEEGKVLRTGGIRGPSVRWNWVEVTQEEVRDAVVNDLSVHPFTMGTLVQKIHSASGHATTPDAVMPHVQRLVERNVLQRTDDGRLKYVTPPNNSPRSHPTTPDKLPVVPVQARGGQAPSGRRTKGAHPETQKILTLAEKQGIKVERTGSGHYAIHCPNERVIIASTPSDHRAILKAKARLRKAGLQGI